MSVRPRVLVVEDEPSLAELLRLQLDAAGFDAVATDSGEHALDLAARDAFAVVLLDVGLSGRLDGIDVCRTLRARADWTPVIFVTARDDEVDRIVGLELGADDYVTKPYSTRELVARVRAHARRAELVTPNRTLVVGELVVDLDAHSVVLRGEEVPLTATEFALLAHLLRHPGRVSTRADLLANVWGYPADDATRTVDTHVAQLRSKLGADCPIRTVRGVGYGITRG